MDTVTTPTEAAIRAARARAAFWGTQPELANYLMDTHGYTLDGVYYRCHSATLAEYLTWVAEMDATMLATLLALDAFWAGEVPA